MIIDIVNISDNELPKYETLLSAGMDLRAYLDDSIVLKPFQRVLVKTGLFISLHPGYEAQVRPRSGLALKKGISVLNSPGTIDADYRGEIGVILINLSDLDFEINSGDRIAQMVIAKHETISWKVVDKLDNSLRGDKGFGSTGK
ncbi:MAG: dUTP diphosphatase [Flavobacteriaceae bacterium]|nr:MAG: dUTP diphosphatase [Bacteroidota bacterium]|tara:strand:- start:1565 stop:1996 length:432 start_codon:yes stop_codon:yes gene_type:complete